MKIQEIRGKTDYELEHDAEKLRRELFDLRFKAPVQSLQSTARLALLRRIISRIETVLHERKLGVRGATAR
ncbi:MAG: 50S ribosomal protein L29 [Planctomycetes bacterium]|nr:50S ribosomal protein L29 [Planctomycetota bacterium]